MLLSRDCSQALPYTLQKGGARQRGVVNDVCDVEVFVGGEVIRACYRFHEPCLGMSNQIL
jgi:hypothetical protein